MKGVTRVAALVWADAVMEGCFFIMQIYLTSVWKLSFTTAAALLNIWGGIHRILPIFFLFLAETLLGNVATLALSGIFSTAGLALIAVATVPFFGISSSVNACEEKVGAFCVGLTAKVFFVTGMALVALGRGARFACTQPFIDDQSRQHEQNSVRPRVWWWWVLICLIVFFVTPVAVIFAFPYVNKWYVLVGFSAVCTAFAALFYLSGVCAYAKTEREEEGNPIIDFCRVFVAAALKINKKLPKYDDGHAAQLHRIDGEEFDDFSSSRILRFLHKAAIILPNDRNAQGEVKSTRSWRVCSVSQVESVKTLIRLAPMWSCLVICGVVSSTGNTYFVEQASHMNFNIGQWKAPIQLLLAVFSLAKCMMIRFRGVLRIEFKKKGTIPSSLLALFNSAICCSLAASVERRRINVLRRHHLLDQPDEVKVPMSALWLWYQVMYLAVVDVNIGYSLSLLFETGAPRSMTRYGECFSEGVIGLGFISSAISVYVVGVVSERCSGKNWFQYTLNRSRLDRYYWVLTVLCCVNLIAFAVAAYNHYKHRKITGEETSGEETPEIRLQELDTETQLELCCIQANSAFGILVSQIRRHD